MADKYLDGVGSGEDEEDVGGASGGCLGDEGLLTKKRTRHHLGGGASDDDMDIGETFNDEDKESASQNALRQPSGAATRALGSQDGQDAEEDEEDEDDWEEVAQRILDADGDHYKVLGVSREGVTNEIIYDTLDRIEAGLEKLPSYLRESVRLAQMKHALHNALNALHSAEARARYDRELEEPERDRELQDLADQIDSILEEVPKTKSGDIRFNIPKTVVVMQKVLDKLLPGRFKVDTISDTLWTCDTQTNVWTTKDSTFRTLLNILETHEVIGYLCAQKDFKTLLCGYRVKYFSKLKTCVKSTWDNHDSTFHETRDRSLLPGMLVFRNGTVLDLSGKELRFHDLAPEDHVSVTHDLPEFDTFLHAWSDDAKYEELKAKLRKNFSAPKYIV
jgi:hypothetical protein